MERIGPLGVISRVSIGYGVIRRRFNRCAARIVGLAVAAALFGTLLGAPVFANVPGDNPPVRILVLGDSLSSGWGLAADQAFPARLESALRARGHAVRLINAGVAGDTTAGGRARLDWALAENPEIVIVELGANDGMRGIDPRATRANLDAILTRLKTRGVRVLLAGMVAPPNLGEEFGREFNAVFPALARRHGVEFYPFFLDGVAARRGLNQPDGIHPNIRGVAVIVDRILPYVVRLLKSPE
jgi:acyl-CoA thioesterase I